MAKKHSSAPAPGAGCRAPRNPQNDEKNIFYRLIALLLVSAGVQAQTKPAAAVPPLNTYRGEYEGGQATYTYYAGSSGQRVRHGRFELVKKVPVFVNSRRTVAVPDREQRTVGSYTNGQRTGTWTTATTTYIRFGGRATDIDSRTTSIETYVNGRLNGPATYAEVPWKAGQPGSPIVSVSARRRLWSETRAAAGHRSAGGEEEETEPAVLSQVIEYGAGPFRYDAAPSLRDPARRTQTARGYFDANGYCDSIWTLSYYKGGSEGEANMYGRLFTPVERAGGWMTTTLTFAHGVLRRERTTQASTGEIISKFSLPASRPYNPASRLLLLASPAHLHDWPAGTDHPDEADWDSPMPKDEDASRFFFREATGLLGAPLLQDVSFQLVPTAADSALLHQAETLLATAHAQWQGMRGSGDAARPDADTTGAALQTAYLRLYDRLRAKQASLPEYATEAPGANFGGDVRVDEDGRKLAHAWLQELINDSESTEEGAAAKAEEWLEAHLDWLRLSVARAQLRLSAARVTPAESAPVTP